MLNARRRYGAERGLQGLQLLEMARELVALGFVGRVGDVFFGILDFSGQRRGVEIRARNGPVGKHRQARRGRPRQSRR